MKTFLFSNVQTKSVNLHLKLQNIPHIFNKNLLYKGTNWNLQQQKSAELFLNWGKGDAQL